jgi:hypothetical protein
MTAQRRYEAPDLGAAIDRMVAGLVLRAAEGDLEAVEQLRRLEAAVPAALSTAVAGARACAGYSWAELAPALGTTRQSASERFRLATPPDVTVTACGRMLADRPTVLRSHAQRCQVCARTTQSGHPA